jgi:hypothetical protein
MHQQPKRIALASIRSPAAATIDYLESFHNHQSAAAGLCKKGFEVLNKRRVRVARNTRKHRYESYEERKAGISKYVVNLCISQSP